MERGTFDGTEGSALLLAEILATRLCHDLAGMLGTVMGALELAQGDPAMVAEALPVADDGAQQLARRLRMLRTAWGGGDASENPRERSVGRDGFLELAAGVSHGRRVTVRLDDLAADRRFTPAAVRLLLNVLMLGVESLHGAGELAMAGGSTGDVIVTITGPRAAWPTGFGAMLANPAIALQRATAMEAYREVQGPLTALIAARSHVAVTMLLGPHAEQAPPLLISLD